MNELGEILEADQSFCELVDYELPELRQRSLWAMVNRDSCDCSLNISQEAAQPETWRTARLITRNGVAHSVLLLQLPTLAVTEAPDSQGPISHLDRSNPSDSTSDSTNWMVLFYANDAVSAAPPLPPPNLAELDQAFYTIHSAASVTDVFHELAKQSQALLPHYTCTGLYQRPGRWSWDCASPELVPEITNRLQQFDIDQILTSLQLGQVRLQTLGVDGHPPVLSVNAVENATDAFGRQPEATPMPVATLSWEQPEVSLDVLLIPVCHESFVFGAILLTPSRPEEPMDGPYCHPMPPGEVAWASAMAKHAALSMARIKRQEAAKEPDKKLVQWVQSQMRHLQQALNVEAAIKRIIEKIRNSLDEVYIFETVMRELGQALVLDACSIGFYDEERQTVDVRYASPEACQAQTGDSDMSTHSEIYGLLKQGLCIQVSSLASSRDRRMVAYSTTLACPIVDQGRTIGDLWLHRPKYALFNEQEQDLILQVAQQCAVALTQARLYQQAQDQVKSLETVGNLKDDFLSTVSHELRTPVTNIKMTAKMLELALSNQPIADERITRYMRILHSEAQREIDLINDLLDLQRLDAGMQTLDLKYIEISWLAQIFESFRERATASDQQLRVEILSKISHFISDEGSLKRIVAELLNNACKYTPTGEFIAVSGIVSETGLHLSICNSGIEISAAEQTRIFKKFYRIKQSDRRRQGGTGLGLALVKQLVHHLQGDIHLTSGSGLTCFTVDLPPLSLPGPEATAPKSG
ncbi:MAG: GAF domain-containing sensor histidine kinase [Cyanobacteria bacterium P01_A01_bin.135]